jgi:hypothetical protein
MQMSRKISIRVYSGCSDDDVQFFCSVIGPPSCYSVVSCVLLSSFALDVWFPLSLPLVVFLKQVDSWGGGGLFRLVHGEHFFVGWLNPCLNRDEVRSSP